jgi:hypothetical protein
MAISECKVHFVHLQESPQSLQFQPYSNLVQKSKSRVSTETKGNLLAVSPYKIEKILLE